MQYHVGSFGIENFKSYLIVFFFFQFSGNENVCS